MTKELKSPVSDAAPPPIFEQADLFQEVHRILSERHVYDDREKLTAFLVACTAYSRDPRDRKSLALIGDSSVGKDNLMDEVLRHFPDEDVIKVTRATGPTLEDDIAERAIVAFSEVNANREGGANRDIVEQLKQLAEGGIHALKKDARTGFKNARESRQSQRTIFFSSTEERRDEELETRFICVGIPHDSRKVKEVNKRTLAVAGDPDLLFAETRNESLLKIGIGKLRLYPVLIPYAHLLAEVFDNDHPRSQRDLKRLLALTKAHAWLYQQQRPKVVHNGLELLISHPVDFLNVYKVAVGFFDMTYRGLEPRLQSILDFIEKQTGGDYAKETPRIQIERGIGCSKNTLKARLEILRDGNFVTCRQEGNDWLYQRCQLGCQRVLIGVSYVEIRGVLAGFKPWEVDTLRHLLTPSLTPWEGLEKAEIDDQGFFDAQGVKSGENADTLASSNVSGDFDTLKLTPSEERIGDPAPIAWVRERGGSAPIGEFVAEFDDRTLRQCVEQGDLVNNPSSRVRLP